MPRHGTCNLPLAPHEKQCRDVLHVDMEFPPLPKRLRGCTSSAAACICCYHACMLRFCALQGPHMRRPRPVTLCPRLRRRRLQDDESQRVGLQDDEALTQQRTLDCTLHSARTCCVAMACLPGGATEPGADRRLHGVCRPRHASQSSCTFSARPRATIQAMRPAEPPVSKLKTEARARWRKMMVDLNGQGRMYEHSHCTRSKHPSVSH